MRASANLYMASHALGLFSLPSVFDFNLPIIQSLPNKVDESLQCPEDFWVGVAAEKKHCVRELKIGRILVVLFIYY
jgi:hypothetical protein